VQEYLEIPVWKLQKRWASEGLLQFFINVRHSNL